MNIRNPFRRKREAPERFYEEPPQVNHDIEKILPEPVKPKRHGGFKKVTDRPRYDATAAPKHHGGIVRSMPRDLRKLKEKRGEM